MFRRRTVELILIDTAIIALIYFATAWLTTLDIGSIAVASDAISWQKALAFYILVMVCRVIFRVYRSIWRYANVAVYLKLAIADLLAGFIFGIVGRFRGELNLGFAYTVLLTAFLVIATLFSRFAYQIIFELRERHSKKPTDGLHQINIAIVGAGSTGSAVAETFKKNRRFNYNPYCFIDIDSQKVGSSLNGIDVIPENDDIVDVIKGMPIQEILIAVPNSNTREMNRLYTLYSQTGCKVKIYEPPMEDSRASSGAMSMREVQIEDLLFRDTISLADGGAGSFYTGKTILVTGGGGSIGSELCRQIAALKPSRLIILDIYENNAYEIQQELIRKYGDSLNLRTVIASVRDERRLEEIFAEERPEVVFHAAAHKHVPLMEASSCEAIKNNVLGTYNVANMAEKYGVAKFLLISTDKAVNPTNVMGASKRLCELVVSCRTDSKTEFVAVRFGNVLGSNGSVIPLFKKQIANGGPVTITDKRIIRYFMTIGEAVSLVMEACAFAKGGDLYVLDMGEPVRILDMAEKMITLSGYRPYKDIDIVEVGLRPGEKLYEELLVASEKLGKTSNKKIFTEHDEPKSREYMEEAIARFREVAKACDYEAIKKEIRQVVDTYLDPEVVNSKVD